MKNNVIFLKETAAQEDEITTPKDLLSFKEFAEKHNMKISYLYKLQKAGKFERHKRGVWKISESEVLQALENLRRVS